MHKRIYSGRVPALVICVVLTTLTALSLYIHLSSRDSLYSLFGDTRMVVEAKEDAVVNLLKMNQRLESVEGVMSIEYLEPKAAQKSLSETLGVSISDFFGNDPILPHHFILTISGTKLLEEGGVESIKKELEGVSWVASTHYDNALSDNAKESFRKIGNLTLYLCFGIGMATLFVFYLALSLSIGGLFNSYPQAAHRQLSIQVYRWSWLHGLLCAVISCSLLSLSVAITGSMMPALGLKMEILPLLCACIIIGVILVSLFFSYVIVMLRK